METPICPRLKRVYCKPEPADENMKESEFNALISLLEDDDPIVASHIEAQLVSMGNEVVPRLEGIWETESHPEVQRRIEDIIHLIQSQTAIEGLRSWQKTGGKDLLEGWLWVTRYQYPELDPAVFTNEITRITSKIWLEFRSGMRISDKLARVNRILFDTERYKSNRRSPYDPQNNYFNTLLQSKKGSPISLGIFYLILCHQLDLPVGGIHLPGYFVLIYPESDPPIFIDVFNHGAFFHKRDLARFLQENKLEEDAKYYQPNSHATIILALIRYLMECYLRRKKAEKVRELEVLLRAFDTE
jgi:regulator of sirC expression with transglutaminase-like and TPR domain